jgi:uncharacterized protein YhfF
MQATAWILDVAHRARRLVCEVPQGMRALEAVEDEIQRALGVKPFVPLGVRAADTAPELLYLVPAGGVRTDFTLLPAWARDDQRGFAFYVEAMLGGWTPPTLDLDVFYFGDGPELAASLAHLVMKGVKRGTTGWVAAAQRDGVAIPGAGTVSIVTDGFGHALCAIRTEQVEHLRFADVTEPHAWVEGEGDRTLADWRAGHLSYFGREAAQLGPFTEDESCSSSTPAARGARTRRRVTKLTRRAARLSSARPCPSVLCIRSFTPRSAGDVLLREMRSWGGTPNAPIVSLEHALHLHHAATSSSNREIGWTRSRACSVAERVADGMARGPRRRHES